jgi:hypothetical protein
MGGLFFYFSLEGNRYLLLFMFESFLIKFFFSTATVYVERGVLIIPARGAWNNCSFYFDDFFFLSLFDECFGVYDE